VDPRCVHTETVHCIVHTNNTSRIRARARAASAAATVHRTPLSLSLSLSLSRRKTLQPVLLNEGKRKKGKKKEEHIGKLVIQCLIMQERERKRERGEIIARRDDRAR